MPLPTDPTTTARLIAAGRIALGLVALVQPRLGGAAFRTRVLPDEAVAGWRLFGARDIALGVGTLMAARRGPGRLRGWVETGALADVLDVMVLGADPGLRPASRAVGALTAASAAGLGIGAARGLSRS